MYMAFVIHEDDEDYVSFYTRTNEGKIYVSTEYIQRGNSTKLNYFINLYMFPKQMSVLSQNKVTERGITEKKALKKRNSRFGS